MGQAHKLWRVLRFLTSGAIAVPVYCLILYTLTDVFGIWYMVSAVAGSIVSQSLNFFLQKFWTFRSKKTKNLRQQAGTYGFMQAGMFVANLLLLYLLVNYAHMWYMYAQAATTVVLTIASYFLTSQIFSDSST